MGRRKPAVPPRRPTSFKQLAAALHKESGQEARKEVIKAHARKLATGSRHDGKIMVCQLSNAEQRGEVMNVGSENKVIYDDWTQASLAARALFEDGQGRQYAYLCPRTADGHHHLTSRAPWRRFDAPGLHKPPALPESPGTREEVEQALSYSITRGQFRPPGPVMASNDDDQIHRWYAAEIDRRWKKIQKGMS